ncbi:hypothetical protein IMG5_126250 [Ichthyophthirius multifiliis]|uniref:Uncharacterized protein n=1 Tax=Ichthyophthirius multifiliis TaxID=5932 RepID=G0QVT1_ICHMU|nr:hypothetical protein IMG5_126250 [Ichthyophthirius multifiliis]EGR30669.1 hypothetical protein IMG5_126250 [Ichthyophthirius multifiliis]|eukprot:XP_004032256.1 hypothetical protein IMG5_126250 [Ichthyophthirius multifiliis]
MLKKTLLEYQNQTEEFINQIESKQNIQTQRQNSDPDIPAEFGDIGDEMIQKDNQIQINVEDQLDLENIEIATFGESTNDNNSFNNLEDYRVSNTDNKSQNDQDEEEVVYVLDENGYLLDENGNYILDDEGQMIKLNEEHIQYLKETNMIEENL